MRDLLADMALLERHEAGLPRTGQSVEVWRAYTDTQEVLLLDVLPEALQRAITAEANVLRLRAALVDALPYIPEHIPRTALLAALAEVRL